MIVPVVVLVRACVSAFCVWFVMCGMCFVFGAFCVVCVVFCESRSMVRVFVFCVCVM